MILEVFSRALSRKRVQTESMNEVLSVFRQLKVVVCDFSKGLGQEAVKIVQNICKSWSDRGI